MAISRVAPVKITTIRQLELTVAMGSIAVDDLLKEEVDLADAETNFWTDFKVVLNYITNYKCFYI